MRAAYKLADKLNMLIEWQCNKRLVIGRVAYRFNAWNIAKPRDPDSRRDGGGSRTEVASMKCTLSGERKELVV